MTDIARLYQGTLSSSSWRVRIALALKGIAYESVQIDIGKGEQLNLAYGDIAPLHQVPCLAIDGQHLYQSVAILEYLEETRPQPPLLPKESARRASVRALVEVVNSVIQPMHNTPVRQHIEARFGVSSEVSNAWARYWIERRFEDFERIIESTRGCYAYGDSVTLADVFLYPQIETTWRFGVDMQQYPALREVTNNLKQLPAFQNSHPRPA